MSAAAQRYRPPPSAILLTRIFDAPRELVWKCFTEPQHMKEWWGPKGSDHRGVNMDLRVGGTYHGAMRDPDGTSVGEVRLSRDRRAGAPGLGAFVFRRSGRSHTTSAEPDLAA